MGETSPEIYKNAFQVGVVVHLVNQWLTCMSHLFKRAGGPHELVHHVDGDPYEGGSSDDVTHYDAPVWELVVE